MSVLEINPYIRWAGQSTILVPYCINRRIIFDYELCYVEDGEFILTYNDRDFHCPKGSILFICPNIPHSFHVSTTDLVQPNIHFDLKYDSLSEKIYICYQDYCDLSPAERSMIRENIFPDLETSPFLEIAEKESFIKRFYSIINAPNYHSLDCKANMLFLLQTIISAYAPEVLSIMPSKAGIASQVKSYIDSNYSQNTQLSHLEGQFGYSKFYLEKLFKQEYGVSVINYRNTKRIEAAARLLAEYSPSKTAQKLGFSSIYVFSRAFRLAYGVSPTEYKKNHYGNTTIE